MQHFKDIGKGLHLLSGVTDKGKSHFLGDQIKRCSCGLPIIEKFSIPVEVDGKKGILTVSKEVRKRLLETVSWMKEV